MKCLLLSLICLLIGMLGGATFVYHNRKHFGG